MACRESLPYNYTRDLSTKILLAEIPALYNYTQSGHALPSAVQMQPRVGLLSIDPDRSTSGIRPLAKWLLGEA